jgi:hypothetical protein
VKLDRSDSPRLKAYMTALSSVRATSPLAEFHQGIVVNVFLLVLLLAPGFPKTIAMALLGLWNIVFMALSRNLTGGLFGGSSAVWAFLTRTTVFPRAGTAESAPELTSWVQVIPEPSTIFAGKLG